MRRDNTAGTILAIGGVLLASQVVAHFTEGTKPGGDVDPAPESDPRPATIDEATASTYADAINAAIWGDGLIGSFTEDEQAVVDVMKRCKVTRDVRLVMNAYGERGPLGEARNLTTTIRDYLGTSDIAAINSDYQQKGISIRF